jgi:farnesyl diphosphate synthase
MYTHDMKAASVVAVTAVRLFEKRLADVAELLEPKLSGLLQKEGHLAEAMRYAVLGAGKRFRPFLVLESANLFGVPKKNALNVAAAIECVHCYSLVHDDLPAMDDDDVRRGLPSVHKKFGEATAILAGDALQSLAFEILSGENPELIREFAKAIGHSGMAGGQQLDLEASTDIEQMVMMKTGALIRFAVLSGAILSGASAEDRHALETYAQHLGLAFQLSDDLLDAKKDAVAGKRTFATLLGVPETKERLAREVKDAIAALAIFGERAEALRGAALFMTKRTQ